MSDQLIRGRVLTFVKEPAGVDDAAPIVSSRTAPFS